MSYIPPREKATKAESMSTLPSRHSEEVCFGFLTIIQLSKLLGTVEFVLQTETSCCNLKQDKNIIMIKCY